MLKEVQLKPHQLEIAAKIVHNKMAYIIADMGAGKTASTLYAIEMLHLLGERPRVLIVAPLNVAKFSWWNEFNDWDFLKQAKVINLAGKTLKQREALLAQEHDYCVINRELLRWLCTHYDFDLPYTVLVYDEISRLKSGRTFTPKRVRKDGTVAPRSLTEFGHLKKSMDSFDRVIGLTGTPISSSLEDLWGQYFIFDHGQRLGRTKNSFMTSFFDKKVYGFGYTEKETALGDITSRINDITFPIDVPIEMPPVEVIDHFVELSKDEYDTYKELEKEYVFTAVGPDHDPVEAVNDGVLYGKLLQLANGAIYVAEDQYEAFHDKKIEKLKRVLDSADGNVLVFYSYKFDLERIKAAIPHAQVFNELENPVEAWNNKEVKVMLLHPASAGHGLNLQFGGHEAVWYGLTNSSELYLQANARLRRPGQLNTVKVHRIMAADTVDEEIGPKLALKGVGMNRFIEGIEE